MIPLAIITRIDPSDTGAVIPQQSVDAMIALLRPPTSFWIVIGLGILISPWMVLAPQNVSKKARCISLALATFLFVAAVLALLIFTTRFIQIFADLLGSPAQLLIFPFVLGTSPLGAALLVFSWYYLHPLSRLQAAPVSPVRAGLKAFTPMIISIMVFGFAVVISIFTRLI